MKNRENGLSAKAMILNVVIVILAFILLVTCVVAIGEIKDNFNSYQVDESSFAYAMGKESYGDMVRYYYQNCGTGDEEQRNLQEYYGVAKYYEAAFFYKLYVESGDVTRADAQRELMNAAAEQMGDFAFVKDKIDAKLQIAE